MPVLGFTAYHLIGVSLITLSIYLCFSYRIHVQRQFRPSNLIRYLFLFWARCTNKLFKSSFPFWEKIIGLGESSWRLANWLGNPLVRNSWILASLFFFIRNRKILLKLNSHRVDQNSERSNTHDINPESQLKHMKENKRHINIDYKELKKTKQTHS